MVVLTEEVHVAALSTRFQLLDQTLKYVSYGLNHPLTMSFIWPILIACSSAERLSRGQTGDVVSEAARLPRK